MDATSDEDWKKSVGFPINYNSGQSSEDEFDTNDVVMRHPRHSSRYLLADGGDGAEADQLGTTPPRSRIRDKEKRRSFMDSGTGMPRIIRERKDVVDHATALEHAPPVPERLKKRASLKLIRNKERDWKQEMSLREGKADSLPSPNPLPAVPTLVESCSRFMSLTSRPKCREAVCPEKAEAEVEERWRCDRDEELPASRVNFHKTFSMLINMGNIDKGCRRTISREEQVWQNELKDLIWLELQAKIAGRTLAQQDEYLYAQRVIVPSLIKNIFEYRFVNNNPCRNQSKRLADIQGSSEVLAPELVDGKDADINDDEDQVFGCLVFDCQLCSEAIGKAMREVCVLLESFYNACSLYPSTKAMTIEYPLIATQLFKNRLKAMCLWYNTAVNMRLKMMGMRRMLRCLRLKHERRATHHRSSVDSDISRQSSESHRPSQVRFNVSNNPSDSNNSDSSAQSDVIKEEDVKGTEQSGGGKERVVERSREEDEVDSGIEITRNNGQITPEIVISDSRYSTNDTSMSSESWTSESGAGAWWSQLDPCELGALHELTQLRLLDKCAVSLYREHHREILKTQGVRRCMAFIYKMRKNILNKVYLTLEKPDSVTTGAYTGDDPAEVFEDSKDEVDMAESLHDENDKKDYELRRYGCWSEECMAMRLPSYRSHFLLLTSICMEAVHDYLSFRLETRPEHPSCLTVKQLIHELKEGLDISSEMRADFVRNLEVSLCGRGAGAAAADLLLLVRTFDNTVENVLKQYLSYLTTMSVTEHMPRAGLQAEWEFTARLAKRIKCASALAPLTFSNIACNQLNRLHSCYVEKFAQLEEVERLEHDNKRHAVYTLCRMAQGIFAGEREATLQAAQWARALAARIARAPPPSYLQQRADIFNSLMAIRNFIAQNVGFVLEKSKLPQNEEITVDGVEIIISRVRELLLQAFKLGFELHKELYKFAQAPFKLLDGRLVRRKRPASLQPLRPLSVVYRRKRPETMLIHESYNPMMHKELHRFVNDPALNRTPSFGRRSISGNTPPRGNRAKLMRCDSVLDDYEASVFDDKLFDNLNNFGECQTQTSIEQLLSGEQPPVEPQVELRSNGGETRVSCEERQWAADVARSVIQFAKCWMHFVVDRCDRGRGTRPRWACHGLEFLMLACDPCNTKHLSDEEFEELKQLMDGCISHVIGSRSPAAVPAPSPTPSPSPSPGGAGAAAATSPRPRHRLLSPLSTNSAPKEVPTPPTPPSEPDPLLCFHGADPTAHSRRVLQAIERVEEERDYHLREAKSVGRVLASAFTSYEPKLRQLTFKWQRGLKIGAGTFGKVYTVVNTESGQLLAMKELSIGAGDRRALQRAANELRVLEGIIHPHLVRYYGCELHREEMLIFMELCVEGSLEALVGTSGALAEHTTRRYTKQLVSAVLELHTRNIVHRDIKSGNIFLTNEGHCLKLGDFGCAVKIRANTTAPYELQGFVGTQAYMAPEVFMKSSGHGRAADIWSLGCVVSEMASGKRPFSEHDYSNYQIMFKVGMGGRPHVPETLSEEGQQFCRGCLTHEPDLRPRAEALTLHSFLMVNSDDDCRCEPAYLMT